MGQLWATVLGLAGLLALAVLMLPAARRLNFPYTVLLAVVGCVLGAVSLLGEAVQVGPVGDFLGALKGFEITSEAVLFVFLPALVFEAALAIDVRRLLDDIGPILFLAVAGLLISTVIVGYTLNAVSGVGLIACLLLGAIVSATDPVAVVAIFKDLGAPKRLAILVEGESLFNDATAIVMFTILGAMLLGDSDTGVLSGSLTFLKVFIGGGVVGYLCARAVCAVIARLRDVPLVEVTLTISLAYLTFIIAEHYLHVSGVVAVVVAALVVGSYGRTTISPDTWHILTETWEQIGFWANSLIFVLVGLAVPSIMADISGREFLLIGLVIVTAFAARAVVIYGLIPLMRGVRLGQRVDMAFKTVMFWGGLRGAVSLALALAVMENAAIAPEIQRFIGVLVTGFVLFTLFVNATTMRPVLAMFGLDKLSPADLAIRNRAMALSLAKIGESIEKAAGEQEVDPDLARNVVRQYRDRVAQVEASAEAVQGMSEADRVRTGLATLANQERKIYLHHFAEGFIEPEITRLLLVHVDDALDGLKARGVAGYEAAVRRNLGFEAGFRLALQLHRRFGRQGPLAMRIAERFEVLLEKQSVLREVLNRGLPRVVTMLGETTGATLRQLLQDRMAATETALAALRLQYPDYARRLQECHLGRIALRLEEADYHAMLEESVINSEVYDDLEREAEARAHDLAELPKLDLGLEPEKLVAKVSFFRDLPAERIAEIVGLLKPRLALPGELIVRKGDAGDAMYFVSTGAVEVALPEPVQLGSGDLFGEIALLTEMPRVADVTALGFCDLLVLYVQDFRKLLDVDPELCEVIERVARERLGENATTA